MGWQSGSTLTPVPIRSRVVRAASAAASTSGTEAIEGIPAPIGSVGFRWAAKWRSASQTPSSPCVSAISAIDIASANASSCVLPSRWSHSITRPTCIWASPAPLGRLAGSGMNRQPWHFIVVREREALRRLGALASSGSYVAQAPLAVVVATDKTRFAVSDASRAIQSMLLSAWADGVGSNWVGFGGLDKVKDLLDVPAGLEVLAILPFGYPARPVGRGKKQRKPLREVAHLERYGRPFE